jgi:hypothetical protein
VPVCACCIPQQARSANHVYWRYLNQYTVLVDAHMQPWLDVSYASWKADVSAEEAEAGDTADGLALVHLFVDWLPQEVAKARIA